MDTVTRGGREVEIPRRCRSTGGFPCRPAPGTADVVGTGTTVYVSISPSKDVPKKMCTYTTSFKAPCPLLRLGRSAVEGGTAALAVAEACVTFGGFVVEDSRSDLVSGGVLRCQRPGRAGSTQDIHGSTFKVSGRIRQLQQRTGALLAQRQHPHLLSKRLTATAGTVTGQPPQPTTRSAPDAYQQRHRPAAVLVLWTCTEPRPQPGHATRTRGRRPRRTPDRPPSTCISPAPPRRALTRAGSLDRLYTYARVLPEGIGCWEDAIAMFCLVRRGVDHFIAACNSGPEKVGDPCRRAGTSRAWRESRKRPSPGPCHPPLASHRQPEPRSWQR